MSAAHGKQSLLIVGLAPILREKPVLWFAKNKKRILRMRFMQSWWRNNTVFITEGETKKLSILLRQITEIGYQKKTYLPAHTARLERGEFLHYGSTIIIFPINEKVPWSVELNGNAVETVCPQATVDHDDASFVFQNRSFSETDDAVSAKNGDFVVHRDHGIGIYRGCRGNADVKTANKTHFHIEYAPARTGGKPDVLLVPEKQRHKLSPYIGFRIPQIHRLGTPLWSRTKKRARYDVIAFAKELLASWGERVKRHRPPYLPDPLEQQVWMDFEHEETLSQGRVLGEILKDMSKPEPMDRLLIGDVGFGKTEIALRAALRAALSGRQVVLLCPTTVLADQHAALFQKRLAALPVIVERFTRLESDRNAKRIRTQAAQGTIDILIGTHRLLRNISFKRLGLLIVDEEQRFGVAQKEVFKKRYPEVDILTCSATPIPRTLSFALARVQQTSFLTDAPKGRIAPITTVAPFGKAIIRRAIMKELAQQGQIYVLANRIRTMVRTKALLDDLFPGVKKGILHGRLGEKEIIRIMDEFRRGLFPILISTTIIENGLDISNANTLIVEDATRLGLAQCYQLRGRVGRGVKPSFAYFLYFSRIKTPEAMKRLEALKNSRHLGAGMSIAEHDLEIRGAGNILGKEQSGAVNTVGWNLYYQMLAEALEEEGAKIN